MTEYTRPSVYHTNFTIDVYDGKGSIHHIYNDKDRFGLYGFVSQSKDVDYLQAVDDGISQLYYQLRKYRTHVRDRIAQEVITANREATA